MAHIKIELTEKQADEILNRLRIIRDLGDNDVLSCFKSQRAAQILRLLEPKIEKAKGDK